MSAMRDDRPRDDQVVDLDGRAIVQAEEAGADHPVGADAALAAEEALEHQRARRHQLADAERDHGEGGGALLGGHVAEDDGEGEPAEAPDERHQFHREPEAARLDRVQQVGRAIPAEAEEHGMPERQEARVPHLHVVAEREDDHHAHLAQHGDAEAGMTGAGPIEEEPRQGERDGERGEPQPVPPEESAGPGGGDRAGRGVEQALAHVSRVPMRPRGLKSRISTSMT